MGTLGKRWSFGGKVELSCTWCNKVFSDYRSNKRRFCSIACARTFQMTGRTVPVGVRKKIGDANRGRKRDAAKVRRGFTLSQEVKDKIRKSKTGVPLSAAHRAKLSSVRMGHTWSRGTRWSEEAKQRYRLMHAKRGSQQKTWKGDKANYFTVHNWVRRNLGRPGECVHCSTENTISGKSIIQWANVDHQYRRQLGDYIPLCVPCHSKHDKSMRENSYV